MNSSLRGFRVTICGTDLALMSYMYKVSFLNKPWQAYLKALIYVALLSLGELALSCPWDLIPGTSSGTCEAAASRAAASNNPNLVISMEGLCSGPNAGAAAAARATAGASGIGAPVMSYSWLGGAQATRCAEIWKNKFGDKLRLTFIGHSFGGGPGRRSAVDAMARKNIHIQNLVMFDPREAYDVRCGEGGGPKYEVPGNVTNVLNFYQCDAGLPGRTFVCPRKDPNCSRHWVKNKLIDGGPNSSHISLPGNRQARLMITDLLRRTSRSAAPMQQLAGENFSQPAAGGQFNEMLQRIFGVTSGSSEVAQGATQNSAPRRSPASRRNDAYWSSNPKADKAAKCFRFGASYDCTYREASEQANNDAYH